MKKLFPYPWYLSFWFSLLAVTLVHAGFFALGGIFSTNIAISAATRVLGLVTPLGPFGLDVALRSGAWPLLFAIIILALSFADLSAKRFGLARGKKVLFNAAALLALTFLADAMLYGGWLSFEVFIKGSGAIASPSLL